MKASPPTESIAGPKRKATNKAFRRCEEEARKLIALRASNWGRKEISASIAVRDVVQAWLQTAPPYLHRKAEAFLRDLDRLRTQALARRSQERRGTGDQNEHPDRNRITEFGPARGRGTWATPKRK